MAANTKWRSPPVAITKRMLDAAHEAIDAIPEDHPDADNEDYLSAQIFFAMWTEMHREIHDVGAIRERGPAILKPSKLILPKGLN